METYEQQKFLEEFITKAKTGRKSFTVGEDVNTVFLSVPVGNAHCIYEIDGVGRTAVDVTMGVTESRFVAVVTAEHVYIKDAMWFYKGKCKDVLKDYPYMIKKEKERLSQTIKDDLMPEYEKLSPDYTFILDSEIYFHARSCKFGNSKTVYLDPIVAISTTDFLQLLTGEIDLKELEEKLFNEAKGNFRKTRAFNEATKLKLQDETLTAPWEEELAKILLENRNKKIVTAIRNDNGKTENISPQILLLNLIAKHKSSYIRELYIGEKLVYKNPELKEKKEDLER
jgi:hypothetical protein